MENIYIVRGLVSGHTVTYGYFKSLEGALANLDMQTEAFTSKGYVANPSPCFPTMGEYAEIVLYYGGEYYGHIRVTRSILND